MCIDIGKHTDTIIECIHVYLIEENCGIYLSILCNWMSVFQISRSQTQSLIFLSNILTSVDSDIFWIFAIQQLSFKDIIFSFMISSVRKYIVLCLKENKII